MSFHTLAMSARRSAPVLSALLFVCALTLALAHIFREIDTVGVPSAGGAALSDFRDAVYYPGVALRDGRNPYASIEYLDHYPVGSAYPLYSPTGLLAHLPLSFLPYRTAQFAYVVLNVGMLVVLAFLSLRLAGLEPTWVSVLTVGGVLLVSRPGEQNLFLGQCTFYVVAGAYVALLHARARPFLAGVGLAVALLKPTIGAPLAVLMLFRGDRQAVLAGAAFSAVAAGVILIPLLYVAGGAEGLIASLQENYRVFRRNPYVDAITSPYRADLVALVARTLGRSLTALENVVISALILSAGAWAVRRQEGRANSDTLTASLICVSVFVCTYHLPYDALLLAAPAVALVARPEAMRAIGARPLWRGLSLVLLMVPALNYFATERAFEALAWSATAWWVATAATSIAGGTLFVLWLVLQALPIQPDQGNAVPARSRVPARRANLAGALERSAPNSMPGA